MSLPQPVLLEEAISAPSRQPRPVTRHRKNPRLAAHHALGWEMAFRLGINLGLSLVALGALVRLVPYYQTQRRALVEIESAVTLATVNAEMLQTEFGLYFDPVEASRLLQAQSGVESGQAISVVLVSPQGVPPSAEP